MIPVVALQRYICWAIGVITFCWSPPALAHESLYHSVEVHLEDSEEVRIVFSVHAPELLLDRETDLSGFGDDWLRARSDAELDLLIERSKEFVSNGYRVEAASRPVLDLFGLQFESFEEIRQPDREDSPRPGCLSASLRFPNPGGELKFFYASSQEKRLLLAELWPKQFPKIHDLEPGEERGIPLPAPPKSSTLSSQLLILLAVPFVSFVIAACFRLAFPRPLGSECEA